MKWLAQLKKLENTLQTTLQNLQRVKTEAFVGFVGVTSDLFKKTEPESYIFKMRLALFFERGLTVADAETMANRLNGRDWDQDERRLCLECKHLFGTSTARRCSQWRTLGIHSAAIPADLPTTLQRCSRFNSIMEITE